MGDGGGCRLLGPQSLSVWFAFFNLFNWIWRKRKNYSNMREKEIVLGRKRDTCHQMRDNVTKFNYCCLARLLNLFYFTYPLTHRETESGCSRMSYRQTLGAIVVCCCLYCWMPVMLVVVVWLVVVACWCSAATHSRWALVCCLTIWLPIRWLFCCSRWRRRRRCRSCWFYQQWKD